MKKTPTENRTDHIKQKKEIKDISFNLWERDVEFAFAQWVFGRNIKRNIEALFYTRGQKKIPGPDFLEFNTAVELQIQENLYIPLDGNPEKIFGDGFFKNTESENEPKFSILEFKSQLNRAAGKREADSGENEKGKSDIFKKILLENRNKEAFQIAEKCHFIVGLKGQKFQYASYWNFIINETQSKSEIAKSSQKKSIARDLPSGPNQGSDNAVIYIEISDIFKNSAGASYEEFMGYLKVLLDAYKTDGGTIDIEDLSVTIMRCSHDDIKLQTTTLSCLFKLIDKLNNSDQKKYDNSKNRKSTIK